jgi:hypothetical protein
MKVTTSFPLAKVGKLLHGAHGFVHRQHHRRAGAPPRVGDARELFMAASVACIGVRTALNAKQRNHSCPCAADV